MSDGTIRLQASQLNDFIGPSLACIKPMTVVQAKPNPQAKKAKAGIIAIEQDGGYVEVAEDGSSTVLQKAVITLSDCLACSGCVTSAETVLVDAQNYKEFLHELRRPPSTATNSDAATTVAQDVEMADTQSERREGGGSSTAPPRTPPSISAPPSTGDGETPTAHTKNPFSKKTFAVSLSPQSTASLAARYLLTIEQSARKLITFLKQLGVSKVYDSSFGRALSLVESRREFHERIVQATVGGSGGWWLLGSTSPNLEGRKTLERLERRVHVM